MRTIIGSLGGLFAGSVAWWLGAKINVTFAIILSLIAAPLGLYFARRWFDDNLG